MLAVFDDLYLFRDHSLACKCQQSSSRNQNGFEDQGLTVPFQLLSRKTLLIFALLKANLSRVTLQAVNSSLSESIILGRKNIYPSLLFVVPVDVVITHIEHDSRN